MRVGPCLALGIALVGSGQAAADCDPLARHRWNSRVLVLSAPDAGDRRLREQRVSVDSARSGFDERDLLVVEAVGANPEADAIRRRLHLRADGFHAVLVGKDGRVKIDWPKAIALERLFSTIDSMPMRRDEVIRRRR